MRRWSRPSPVQEQDLTAYLRSAVWGPAEFIGRPPPRLVGEGILVGALGAGSIVGAGAAGDRTGLSVLVSGEAGLVCAGILVLYLVLLRAGRALVGIVAVLGVCLALQAPQVVADVVSAGGERVVPRAVTSGEGEGKEGAGGVRRPCPAVARGGAPIEVRVRRDCGRTTRPGDALAVVHGPEGRMPPRAPAGGPLRALAALAAALLAGCVLAVVRSHRLAPADATV
ncbi:hypothetical protein [Streptomyces sp. NPDC058751]|uniref:hypothetical protein n=1 Tax=Streptomyces sp. NPDC058751 TaxID=3346623 RepID=UPI0036860384